MVNETQLARKEIADLIKQLNWLLQNPQTQLAHLNEVKDKLNPIVTKLKELS